VSIDKVIELLEREHGPRRWQPDSAPVDVLIGTILSQNTSDVNSKRAFDSLRATFGSWEDVASAPVGHIAQAIKSGGLSRIKAVRIKDIVNAIKKEQGRISLDFLNSIDATEARDYLMHLSGVGLKTASPCLTLVRENKFRIPLFDPCLSAGHSVRSFRCSAVVPEPR
jgi:Predicted EndoIII-related endonuclease